MIHLQHTETEKPVKAFSSRGILPGHIIINGQWSDIDVYDALPYAVKDAVHGKNGLFEN